MHPANDPDGISAIRCHSARRIRPQLRWLGGIALLIVGCGTSTTMARYQGDEWMDSFMQANYQRYFRVHVPRRDELGPAAPLVLAFHGSAQNGTQLRELTDLDQAADAAGFIVAYMEAAVGAWDIFGSQASFGLDEPAYVREVIDRIDARYVIDRRRIIAVGLSNGGVFVQRLGCIMADQLAGFVAVAASLPRRMVEECSSPRPISALYLLGTDDRYFPASGTGVLLPFDSTLHYWASVDHCGIGPVSTTSPDVADDGTTVHAIRYHFCREGAVVQLDSIVGGGHTWPGSDVPPSVSLGITSQEVSANQEIIRFLADIPPR